MLNPQIISENIICLRQRLGLTQQELAAKANVTHQAVSKWENGSSIPDLQTLMTLSRLFGVSLDELLTEVLAERRGPELEPAPAEEAPARPAEEEEETPPERPAEEEAPREPADKPAIDLHALVALAPFTPKDKLAELVLAHRDNLTLDSLVALAPFLGRQALDGIVAQMDLSGVTPSRLMALAPFISREALSECVGRIDPKLVTPNHLAALAPFLGQNALGELIRKIGQLPMKALTALAPFLSKETIGEQLEGLTAGRAVKEEKPRETRQRDSRSDSDRLALRLAEEGDFDEIEELLPRLSRETRSRVIDMALDADDFDFLTGSAFNMLSGDEQRKIALHMAENGDFDEISDFFDHLSGETRGQIISMALDQDETDFLRSHLNNLSRETQQFLAVRLAENGDFDEIGPFFYRLDEDTRARIIRLAMDAEDLDFLAGRGTLIPDDLKRRIALRIAENGCFDELMDLIPLNDLDDTTLNRLAQMAREQDESAFLRKVNVIRAATGRETAEQAEAADAASAMAAARQGDFAAVPAFMDRLTDEEKDEVVRLAIVYDDTEFLAGCVEDLPKDSLETLCFSLARMGEIRRLAAFEGYLTPEARARVDSIVAEKP